MSTYLKQTCFIFFAIFTHHIIAQNQFCDSSQNKKARIFFNEATILMDSNKPGGISLLKKSIKEDTTFAAPNFSLGEIYYTKTILSQYDIKYQSNTSYYFRKAEDNLLRTTELCESYNDYASFYYLGELYFINHEYALANYYLDYFISHTTFRQEAIQKAKNYIEKYKQWKSWNDFPHNITITPVANVCSNADEYLPYITHDGKELYFTRKHTKTKANSIYTETVEEFFICENVGMDSANSWLFNTGKIMSWPFNDGRNQGAISMSANGNEMFITLCQPLRINNRPFKNCDIYYTVKENNYWIPLETLGNNINSNKSWEAQPSVSSNGKLLFFASKRPNTLGGSDIFFCKKDTAGKWSIPINAGPVINTINDEKAPFIHFDNQTLYFASDGLFGLGGFDIFVTRLNSDGEWEKPVNLGKPFNTVQDEIGFVVDARGTKAYFSSNHLPGVGGWDIFEAEIPESLRPKEMFILNGKIVDPEGKAIPDATITLISTKNTTKKKTLQNNNGYFSEIKEIENNNFIIVAEAKGFTFGNELIRVSDKSNGSFKKIEIKRINKGTRFDLGSVLFDSDSYQLSYEAQIALGLFSHYLKAYPELKFNIVGYTDNSASAHYNQELSEQRAKAVYDYLVGMGISAAKMQYFGKGENDPLNKNLDYQQKAKNRRILIEITKY